MSYQGFDNSSFGDSLKLTAGPDNSTIIEWDISIEEGLFNNSALFRNAEKVNWYLSLNIINVEYLPGKINHFTYCASSDIGTEQLPNHYPTYLTFQ